MSKKILRVIAALTLVSGLCLATATPAAAAPVMLGDAPVVVTWFASSAFWNVVRDLVGDWLTKDGAHVDPLGTAQNGSGG